MSVRRLTVLKVHGNVVAADVRSHCYDWRRVELADQVTCRYAVEVRHDNIHEHEVVFGPGIHFVHRLETIKLNRLAHVSFRTGQLHTALSMAH